MERVTGIGGVFLKAKDPEKLAAWYQKHLGIPFGDNPWVTFRWKNNDPAVPGSTVFSFFKNDTTYFDPGTAPFMINFRVADLDSLIETLKLEGVQVETKSDSLEYGKFGWCIDPEGNKIELWEPVDEKL